MQTQENAGSEKQAGRSRVIQFSKAGDDAHARRLAALKRRIEKGSYEPDPEAIAEALLDSDVDVGQ